jgi:hypothetical protein
VPKDGKSPGYSADQASCGTLTISYKAGHDPIRRASSFALFFYHELYVISRFAALPAQPAFQLPLRRRRLLSAQRGFSRVSA